MLSQASTSRGIDRRAAAAGLLAGAAAGLLAGLLAGAVVAGTAGVVAGTADGAVATAPPWPAVGVGFGAGALVGAGGVGAPQADDQATTRPAPARPVSCMSRRRER
jgi:hypothetical protein